jgi:hypothetical protein
MLDPDIRRYFRERHLKVLDLPPVAVPDDPYLGTTPALDVLQDLLRKRRPTPASAAPPLTCAPPKVEAKGSQQLSEAEDLVSVRVQPTTGTRRPFYVVFSRARGRVVGVQD